MEAYARAKKAQVCGEWSTWTPEYGPQARQSRHIACAPTDYLVGYYLFAGFSGVLQRAKHEETECVRFSRI